MSEAFHDKLDHLVDVIAELRSKKDLPASGPKYIELSVAVTRATRMLEAYTRPVITREMMQKATANIRAKVAEWRAKREAATGAKGA